jgi:predicted ribosomally synthesized peptide with SipW-like signal peptide
MRKTLLGVAGIAVATTLIGGATFAAWSDFAEINGNESGAGILTIDVTANDGTPTFTVDDMVPGGSGEQNIYLVNRDSDAVPLANLTMSFENVIENENGCSSNSEEVADPTCVDDAPNTGEFGAQAHHQWLRKSAGSPLACGSTGYGKLNPSTHSDTLAQSLARTYDLGDLGPGEGVCLRMVTSLPIGADNAVQGDSVDFDVRFDLTQVTNS